MHRYQYMPTVFADECCALVSRDEAVELAASLKADGLEAWLDWEYENRVEAIVFLSATPRGRALRKSWKDPSRRSRLALAAHRLGRLAGGLLATVAFAYKGLGYRKATAAVVRDHDGALDDFQFVWPFFCLPPFEEWPVPNLDFYYLD